MVVASKIANFAVQHMLAAVHFSRELGKLEREHKGEPGLILHNAVACVFAAHASLEAYANELFSGRTTIFRGYSEDLLNYLWTTYEGKPVLEKFQFAVLLLGKEQLNHGATPYQDIKILIDLRNALTHFKPELDTEADEHKKMSNKLMSKIKPSPLFSDELFLFPRRWASHSCSTWAVNSAMAFAKEFEKHAGLPSKYGVVPEP